MDLAKILRKVGSGILSSVIPGYGLITETINAFLPDDKKVSGS